MSKPSSNSEAFGLETTPFNHSRLKLLSSFYAFSCGIEFFHNFIGKILRTKLATED